MRAGCRNEDDTEVAHRGRLLTSCVYFPRRGNVFARSELCQNFAEIISDVSRQSDLTEKNCCFRHEYVSFFTIKCSS